jgi:hypothetical protein
MTRALAVLVIVSAAVIGLPPAMAAAHDEREPKMPDGSGHVPAYRTDGPKLLVCKSDRADFERRVAGFDQTLRDRNLTLWDECQRDGYRHVQEAVNNARLPGTNILVLPGLYQEEPSLAEPTGGCANLDAPWAGNHLYQVLSWEQQLRCPNVQNLVAVLDKKELQIEGTGAQPEDVVLDAQFKRLNGIRADRANGFYVKNLTAQRTTFNAIYVLETDGFVIDHSIGRWNDEYGFLTFADDHGLYTDCEAYGNGDSGVYPGAASNLNATRKFNVDRYAIEVRGCKSHHNALGYSGTAGNSVWAHDNEFTQNGTGVATDSAFPNHPGLPQNHAKFERNLIADNNTDYYRYIRDGTCFKPHLDRGYENGVVCPFVGIPTGTGVINPGGNYNVWQDNWVYGNSYAGFILLWVPGFVRKDNRWGAQFDTSHHNRFLANHLGVTRSGESRPNGLDFWWDGQGLDNCWQSTSDSEPVPLPACSGGLAGLGTARYLAEPAKLIKNYQCNTFNWTTGYIPGNCEWFGARGLARLEVQIAAGEAVLLALIGFGLWWRRLRGSRTAGAGMLAALAGLVVGVFGTAYDGTVLSGLGLVLFGAGSFAVGWVTRRAFGVLTMALGVIALLDGVDRSVFMLPWIPVGPVWLRVLVELVWVPWALVVLARRVPAGSAVPDTQPADETALAT